MQHISEADLRPYESFVRSFPATLSLKAGLGMDREDVHSECRARVVEALRKWRQTNAPGTREERAYTKRAIQNMFRTLLRASQSQSRCASPEAIGSITVDDGSLFEPTAVVGSAEDEYLRREREDVLLGSMGVLRARMDRGSLELLCSKYLDRVPLAKLAPTVPAADHRIRRARAEARRILGASTFEDLETALQERPVSQPNDLSTEQLATIALVHDLKPSMDREELVAQIDDLNKGVGLPDCFGEEYDAADPMCTEECDFNRECNVCENGDPAIEAQLVQLGFRSKDGDKPSAPPPEPEEETSEVIEVAPNADGEYEPVTEDGAKALEEHKAEKAVGEMTDDEFESSAKVNIPSGDDPNAGAFDGDAEDPDHEPDPEDPPAFDDEKAPPKRKKKAPPKKKAKTGPGPRDTAPKKKAPPKKKKAPPKKAAPKKKVTAKKKAKKAAPKKVKSKSKKLTTPSSTNGSAGRYQPLSNRKGVPPPGQRKCKHEHFRLPQGSAVAAAQLPVGSKVERAYQGHLYVVEKIEDGKVTKTAKGKRRQRDGKWKVKAVHKGEDASSPLFKRHEALGEIGSLGQLAFLITGARNWSGARFFGLTLGAVAEALEAQGKTDLARALKRKPTSMYHYE